MVKNVSNFFWVVMLYSVMVGYQYSEGHAASIFRVKYASCEL
jgi:hypothetical protein